MIVCQVASPLRNLLSSPAAVAGVRPVAGDPGPAVTPLVRLIAVSTAEHIKGAPDEVSTLRVSVMLFPSLPTVSEVIVIVFVPVSVAVIPEIPVEVLQLEPPVAFVVSAVPLIARIKLAFRTAGDEVPDYKI